MKTSLLLSATGDKINQLVVIKTQYFAGIDIILLLGTFADRGIIAIYVEMVLTHV